MDHGWAGKIAAIGGGGGDSVVCQWGKSMMLQLPLFPDTFHTLVTPPPNTLRPCRRPNAIATCQVCISICTGVGTGDWGWMETTINNGPLGELFSSWGQTMEHGHYRLLWPAATATATYPPSHRRFRIRLWL